MANASVWDDLFLPDNIFQDRDYVGNEQESSDDDSEYDSDEDIAPPAEDPNSADTDDEDPIRPAIQVERTAQIRMLLDEKDLVVKVIQILRFMDSIGMNIPIFLDALSWGDNSCTQNAKVRYERSALLNSRELPSIIRRWLKPPRAPGSKKKRARGAAPAIKEVMLECIGEVIDKELEVLGPHLKSPAGDDVRAETLTSTGFEGMQRDVEMFAPSCLRLLGKMATTASQERRNKEKNPAKVRVWSCIASIRS